MTEATPSDDLVTLTTAASEFEAQAIVAVLQEAGIEAFAFGAVQAWYPLAGQIAVPVQVRQADVDRAEVALKQNVADSIDLDWNDVDLGQTEDDVPVAHPHADVRRPPMPLAAWLGFLIAVALVAVMFIGAIMAIWPHRGR